MTLADLKVGDKAVIDRRSAGWGSDRSIVPILRVTRTQIVINEHGHHEQRWNRDSGRLVGGTGYGVPYLRAGTPELLAEVRAANRKTRLVRLLKDDTKWGDLDLALLEQVAALLPRAEVVQSEGRADEGKSL